MTLLLFLAVGVGVMWWIKESRWHRLNDRPHRGKGWFHE